MNACKFVFGSWLKVCPKFINDYLDLTFVAQLHYLMYRLDIEVPKRMLN